MDVFGFVLVGRHWGVNGGGGAANGAGGENACRAGVVWTRGLQAGCGVELGIETQRSEVEICSNE